MTIPDPTAFTSAVRRLTLIIASLDALLILLVLRFFPTGDYLRMIG